jgi:hypothetical protein
MTESRDSDGLNTPVIAAVGFVSAVLTFALIVAVQVLYYHVSAAETDRKVIAVRAEEADDMQAQQDAKLARYGWLDRAQGRVAVPVERAMELVVRELQEQQKNQTQDAGKKRPAPAPAPALGDK